ncbi:MAG: DUF1800 domain-containing protein, partial [Betaproteobacteria bacterium]
TGQDSTAPATEKTALHVLNRIGYGPRSGDVEMVNKMGVARYIQMQLYPENIALPGALATRLAGLGTEDASAGEILREYNAARKDAKEEKKDKADKAGDLSEGQMKARQVIGRIAENTAEARLARAIESPRQLEEVMVDFWFNHFNVYANKGLDRALVSSYERDAIRPNVFGNFRTLLGATAKHPAMLFYLDNWMSTVAGYQPRRGKRGRPDLTKAKQATGLNENYARELMELHTLGVDGGYTQRDVTELARMLTGWTFNPRELARNDTRFTFNEDAHDRGRKVWLGREVNERGQREGEMALDVLALHPATAHHLSYKLAQYFVSDNPPEALVKRMAARYLETKGEIRPVMEVLLTSPEFLDENNYGSKFKTPYQFVVSAARASAIPITNIRPLLGTLTQLGMPLYGSVTPDGYKNTEAAWLNPDALTRRINFATALSSGRLPLESTRFDGGQGMGKKQLEKQADATRRTNVAALDAEPILKTLGASISPDTAALIRANPEKLRAAMVLGSPDFMRH